MNWVLKRLSHQEDTYGYLDHFYKFYSVFSDADVSTHYVNLPFLFDISAEQRPIFSFDRDDLQHKRWFGWNLTKRV